MPGTCRKDADHARSLPGRYGWPARTWSPGARPSRTTHHLTGWYSSPERPCYPLMSQNWREIELDFMLAVSARAHSILTGGASVEDRGARQAESDVARAAVMLGMFYRRLDSKDTATGDGAGLRVLEDNRHGVTWQVKPAEGAVE